MLQFTSIEQIVGFVLLLAGRIAAEEGDNSVSPYFVGYDNGVLEGICAVMNLLTGTDVNGREVVDIKRAELADATAALDAELDSPDIFDDNDQGW